MCKEAGTLQVHAIAGTARNTAALRVHDGLPVFAVLSLQHVPRLPPTETMRLCTCGKCIRNFKGNAVLDNMAEHNKGDEGERGA